MLVSWANCGGLNSAVAIIPFADAGSGAVNTTPSLNSVLGAVSVTRATNGACRQSNGLWNLAVANNVARSHYGLSGAYLGVLYEPAATQLVTPSASVRDMTDASWIKVNVTAAKTATGIDGVANSATTLTATAINGTILQTLVAAATSRTYSVFLRRKVGTGTIGICQDGVTFTDISAQLDNINWIQVQLNATQLNAAYGLRFGTSADSVEADENQFEAGEGATTPIPSAGTRNADVISFPYTPLTQGVGTMYAEMSFASKPNLIASLIASVNIDNSGTPTNNNILRLVTASPSAKLSGIINNSGVQATFTGLASGILQDTVYKAAMAFSLNNMGFCASGSTAEQVGAGTPPTDSNRLIFITPAGNLSACVKNVIIYKNRLTNSQLTALVTSPLPVILSNGLLRFIDNNPSVRNDNGVGSAISVSTTVVPIIQDSPTLWRMYLEGNSDTNNGGLDNTTGPVMATAPSSQGPWTISPSTRLIDPLAGPAWEKWELSVCSMMFDTANNRWIAWYHGGNNSGATGTNDRAVGVMYSTDGFVGKAWVRDAGNPVMVKSGAGTDNKSVSDLKMIKLADGSYVGLYDGRQTGGPGDGTIHRVTAPAGSPQTLTKTGQVIKEGIAGSWNVNGHYPGGLWKDPSGRLHIYTGAASTGAGSIGYFYSDNNGISWIPYTANPIMPAGAGGSWEAQDTGQVVQAAIDRDVLTVTFGGLNLAFATNPPLRGAGAAITPARVTNPGRVGKFHLIEGGRMFTTVTGTSALSTSVFWMIIKFRAFRLQRALQNRSFFTESAAFNITQDLSLYTDGKIGWNYRTPTAQAALLKSLAVVDDAIDHYAFCKKISVNSYELVLDGVSQATDATNCGTDPTATTKAIGNWNIVSAGPDLPSQCTISAVITGNGSMPTYAQAKAMVDSHTLSGFTPDIDFPISTTGVDTGNVALVDAT